MIIKIGIVAGEIWHILDQHDEISLSDLIGRMDKGRDTILMSLGWLAREGHVVLKESGGDYNIALRRGAPADKHEA